MTEPSSSAYIDGINIRISPRFLNHLIVQLKFSVFWELTECYFCSPFAVCPMSTATETQTGDTSKADASKVDDASSQQNVEEPKAEQSDSKIKELQSANEKLQKDVEEAVVSIYVQI